MKSLKFNPRNSTFTFHTFQTIPTFRTQKVPPMAKQIESPAEPVSFEAALEQIQQIGQELEAGALGLEESLEKFETGVRLIRQCHATLEQAEQRIKVLTDVDAEGNPKLEDFDATSTMQQNKQSAGRRKKKTEEPTDDQSSLF